MYRDPPKFKDTFGFLRPSCTQRCPASPDPTTFTAACCSDGYQGEHNWLLKMATLTAAVEALLLDAKRAVGRRALAQGMCSRRMALPRCRRLQLLGYGLYNGISTTGRMWCWTP
ncbi:arabidopsis phospholipase-like protein [Striga asiatica]|uniref:Arabidopsis phospholipase-like protein n=1 Tax=Striga asiatica TaxID=4170 RepID=A0A5A7QTP3_STRAF|nr:arabidopsis phospholipase-like protein [Striga asiatica]